MLTRDTNNNNNNNHQELTNSDRFNAIYVAAKAKNKNELSNYNPLPVSGLHTPLSQLAFEGAHNAVSFLIKKCKMPVSEAIFGYAMKGDKKHVDYWLQNTEQDFFFYFRTPNDKGNQFFKNMLLAAVTTATIQHAELFPKSYYLLVASCKTKECIYDDAIIGYLVGNHQALASELTKRHGYLTITGDRCYQMSNRDATHCFEPNPDVLTALQKLSGPDFCSRFKPLLPVIEKMSQWHLTFNQAQAWMKIEVRFLLLCGIEMVKNKTIPAPLIFLIATYVSPMTENEARYLANKMALLWKTRFERARDPVIRDLQTYYDHSRNLGTLSLFKDKQALNLIKKVNTSTSKATLKKTLEAEIKSESPGQPDKYQAVVQNALRRYF